MNKLDESSNTTDNLKFSCNFLLQLHQPFAVTYNRYIHSNNIEITTLKVPRASNASTVDVRELDRYILDPGSLVVSLIFLN